MKTDTGDIYRGGKAGGELSQVSSMELVLCSLWLSRRYFGGGREQGRQGGGHKTVDWKGLLKGVHEGSFESVEKRKGWERYRDAKGIFLSEGNEKGNSSASFPHTHLYQSSLPTSLPPSLLPSMTQADCPPRPYVDG